MTEIARQPTGTPAGGQFAATARTEPPTALAVVDPCAVTDDDVMDRIALMLGTAEEWDGSADYLEEIADLIHRTGRPHPGTDEPEDVFEANLDALIAERPTGASPTTKALDALARHLGTTPDWSSEDLEEVTNQVVRSGRPNCGGGISTGDYLASIIEAQAERAPSYQDATEILLEGLGTYLREFGDDPQEDLVSFEVTPRRDDETGAWSYSTDIEIRGTDEDTTVDVAGSGAQRLLTALVRNAPKRGELATLTGE